MGDIVYLRPWKTFVAPFCCYVEDHKGKVHAIIFPDGQQLNTENMNVIIHDNGIEFLEVT